VGAVNYRTLKLRRQGPAWHVQLNRPEAGNTIDARMVGELEDVLGTLVPGSGASILVLEGQPEVFSLGADFGEIGAAAADGQGMAFDPQQLFGVLERLAFGDVISVAHVRGKAHAGGVGLAAACDVVLADASAVFSLSELLFGLAPAVIFPFLLRRLGFQRAHYLASTTQPVGARQACEWGLVDAFEERSDLLLARHLSRMRRMPAAAVARYKAYVRELAALPAGTREAALRLSKAMFADPQSMAAIRRYAEQGLFPWETA
jgi:enoyl-CoA hydratase/carnithine racemase